MLKELTMRKNETKIIAVIGLILAGSACDMAEKYKGEASHKTFMVEGSKKASEIEAKLGGCKNGMMVVEAFADQPKNEFKVQASGFISETAVEKGGFSVMGMSDMKEAKGFKDKESMSNMSLELRYVEDPNVLKEKAEDITASTSRAEIQFQKAGGKLVIKGSETLGTLKNESLDYSTVRAKSQMLSAAEIKGVGGIVGFALKSGLGAIEREFPPDVQAGGIGSLSVKAGEDLVITIPAGAASSEKVLDMLSAEIFIKPNNPAKDKQPKAIYYTATPAAVDGKITFKVPTKGLPEGPIFVDVTHHRFSTGSFSPETASSAKALSDEQGEEKGDEENLVADADPENKTAAPAATGTPVCIDSRSTVRVSGAVAK